MFELILNVLLFVFFGWSFFTHVLEAPVPVKVQKNPYALQPDVWPKAIIILLEICLLINIIKIIKKNKGKEDFTLAAFCSTIPNFFKSKLFIGIVILTVASFILYIIFSGLLSVNLPRGYGFLRDFALALENIVQSVKNLFGGKKEAADAAETAAVVFNTVRTLIG